MPDTSALCLACGLCCDGSLYRSAVLEPDEPAPGFETARIEGKPVFALPCRHLCGLRCSIYPNRPKVCGSYRCKLLKGVQEDNRDLDAALATVATARTRVAALLEASGGASSLADSRMEQAMTRDPRLQLEAAALARFFDRHFRWPEDAGMTGPRETRPPG